MGAISITFTTIGITGPIDEEEVARIGGKMNPLFAENLENTSPGQKRSRSP
jgi:hypothetical protein